MIVDEEQHLRDQHWHPKPGDTVLDIGCYHGAWTLPALQAGATVHAFDSNPDAIATLEANAHHLDEHLAAQHLTTTLACVGLPYPPALKAQVQQLRPTMTPDGPWITIDEYCSNTTVDWIKLDIEGGEYRALDTAWLTLERDHPRLVIEEHGLIYPWLEEHDNLGSILRLLHGLGYETTVSTIDGYDLTPRHIIAT